MQNKKSKTKKSLVVPGKVADPCPEKPYPMSCFNALGDCTCDNGEARDKPCRDDGVGQGLHNLLVSMSNAALQWADSKPSEINAQNRNYRYLMDYDGPEWALGLIKTILLHQHEAISGMQQNTMLTIGVYAIMTFLIFVQYVFLGMKIQTLLSKNVHIAKIVSRLEVQCEHWDANKDRRKGAGGMDGDTSGSDTEGPIEESGSEEDLASEEEPEEEPEKEVELKTTEEAENI